MNIWTFKKSILSFGLGLSLAACSQGGEGFSFAASGERATAEKPRRNVALRSADMMQGGMKLVPPDGFCIDKRNLRQDFAILARCDSLGGKGGAQDAELGMITVALVEVDGDPDTTQILRQSIPQGSEIKRDVSGDQPALVQLSGATPEGSDAIHWRGRALIGHFAMGLAAYAPEGGALAGSDGATALKQLTSRTEDASIAKAVARKTENGDKRQQKGLGKLISGLFD